MKQEIRITKKAPRRGDDGHKIVSVRMRDETITQLDELSRKTNRSRNELINMLIEASLKNVLVIDETDPD